MRVLRAAVVLGLSTPLAVLACGSDDGASAPEGAAGDGGDGAVAAGANAGGSSSHPTGGDAPSGGGTPSEGGSGTGGAAASAGAAGESGGGGAGGAVNEPEPACGDGVLEGGLVCFDAPLPFTLVEGTPMDLAIGEWDAADGLDVIVANTVGLSYFSNQAPGGFTTDTYVGTVGVVLGAGQLDSGGELDLLLGPENSGVSSVVFGDGAGAVTTTEQAGFNSEGVLFNYFVADVAGSAASQDLVVTFGNSVSVVLTTGTEGEGFTGPVSSIYPPSPQDGVLAKLGSSQWLVYSAQAGIYRHQMTYSAGGVTLGEPLTTPAGGAAAQLDVADFNEDGFDDVAATLTGSGKLNVLFGDGIGTGDFAVVSAPDRFLTLTIGASEEAATQRDVKAGDFNGDGHADLAVSIADLQAIAVFSGDGEGAFSGPELVSTGESSGPTRLAVGDLNDDGVDDLAVVGGASGQVVILLSDP